MANKISNDKKQIGLVLPIEMIKKLDARAALEGTSRTAVISAAVDAYLGKSDSTDSAKLDAIAARLDAMDASNRLAVAGVLDAVKNQPIAVQQLPAAEPAERELAPADVRSYLEDRYPGRFVFYMFDEPEFAPRKGLAARLFGRS